MPQPRRVPIPPPPRRRSGWLLLAAVGLLATGGGGYAVFDQQRGGGGYAASRDDGAAQASADAYAARRAVARLQTQVEDLELRLKVVEAQQGYRALDGTVLPAVPDPLAPRHP